MMCKDGLASLIDARYWPSRVVQMCMICKDGLDCLMQETGQVGWLMCMICKDGLDSLIDAGDWSSRVVDVHDM